MSDAAIRGECLTLRRYRGDSEGTWTPRELRARLGLALPAELLDRAARDDYSRWLSGAAAVGGCVRPVRLHGTVRDVDTATGEILSTFDTDTLPDGVI